MRFGVLPETPFLWDEGIAGEQAWDASHRIRQTIDDITACVAPDSILILESKTARQTEYGAASNGWWKLNSRFCTVHTRAPRPCVDAFVEAVNTAAHERAHSRWTPAVLDVCFPLGWGIPDDETPEQERRRLHERQAFNLLEDHRIERLLDSLEEPTLQEYRRKAAVNALALYDVVEGTMSRRIASCLHIYTLGCTVDAEHAWDRAMEIGMKSGVSPVPLRSALHLMAMVESCLENVEPMQDLLQAVTDLFARADGSSFV